MNPNKYKGEDIQPFTKKEARLIWEKDKEKINACKQNGYEVMIVW